MVSASSWGRVVGVQALVVLPFWWRVLCWAPSCRLASSSACSMFCGVLGGVSRQDGSRARLLWRPRPASPGRLLWSSRLLSLCVSRPASHVLRSLCEPRDCESGVSRESARRWASDQDDGEEGMEVWDSVMEGEVRDWRSSAVWEKHTREQLR